MRLEPFAMERLQSTWENRVAWSLAGGDAGTRWHPDMASFEAMVTPKTRLIHAR